MTPALIRSQLLSQLSGLCIVGWEDTFAAEYVAATQVQADALVTLDPDLADAVQGLVTVAAFDALT